MPKLFGLNVRDIVSTPGQLKLEANSVKQSSSTSPSSRKSESVSPLENGKHASLDSANLFKRFAKHSKTDSSITNINMDSGDERRRLIDQRISDLSALLDAMGFTNGNDRHSSRVAERKSTSQGYEEVAMDANRTSGFRRRTALSSVNFEPPASTTDSAEQLNEHDE